MSRSRISPRARKDLRAISKHISKDSPAAAKRIVIELQSVCKTMLAAFPRAGTQRDDLLPGMRCFSVGNYVIFFRGEIRLRFFASCMARWISINCALTPSCSLSPS